MTRRGKRAHIPKVRGCYECSQRRINCDRGQPECSKCLSKGIRCSGLGIRYRFNDDVALKDKSLIKSANAGSTGPNSLTRNRKTITYPNDTESAEPSTEEDAPFDSSNFLSASQEDEFNRLTPKGEGLENIIASHLPLLIDSVSEAAPAEASEETSLQLAPQLRLIDSWKEYLLEHFSKRIAPEMALIDDPSNGWRSFVLPIAHDDDLVMNAVLAASAYHLAVSVGDRVYNPSQFYGKAICGLRQRQDLSVADTNNQQSVVFAILVLLVTVLVNGDSDFPALFALLESALSVIGGEEQLKGESAQFLRMQIRKLRGYAAPLLSQPKGVARLSLQASDGYEEHWYYEQRRPDQLNVLAKLFDLQHQACKIYTTRASLGPTVSPLNELVEDFQNTLKCFPPGSPVEHTLIWPTFIAACESKTPEHREFFIDALMRHHKRNSFANIPKALGHLRKIWSRQLKKSWPMLLPESQIFLI